MDLGAFVKQLQSADDRTKQRWVVAASVVCMAVVLVVWFKYFNAIAAPAASEPAAEGGQGFSFVGVVKSAAGNVYNWFVRAAENVGSTLRAPRDYLIRPPQ